MPSSNSPEVKPIYRTTRPNEPICLSRCENVEAVLSDGTSEKAKAQVAFRFLPTPEVCVKMPPFSIHRLINSDVIGLTFLNRGFSVPVLQYELNDLLTVLPRFGAITIPESNRINHVVFHVVNFHEFYSHTPDVHETSPGGTIRIDKVELTTSEWRCVLALTPDARQNIRAFRRTPGYSITHVGKLERVDGRDFGAQDAQGFLHSLHYLLSFARGAWCAPILPVGFDDTNQPVWREWSRKNVWPWGYRKSWFDGLRVDALADTFPGFMSTWTDPRWYEAIRGAIYWYLLANDSTRGVDAGIILTQAALELLSYVYLVEIRQDYTNTQFRGQSASTLINQLLTYHGISDAIPVELTTLRRMSVRPNIKWATGSQAFVELRNDIAHAKRRFETEPTSRLAEGWTLGLWYLELILLKLFSHTGVYANRLHSQRGYGQVENVP